MRNFKKLFAVIMAVAMLASIMVPALAADSFKYEAEAKKLYDLGLFKGTSETSYVPDLGTALTRETGLALMIRAMGKDAEANALSKEDIAAQLAKVVDKDTINSWAEPYVAYAIKNGLTDGIDTSILPNIKFGGQIALSGQEFIYFMLKAMGYTKADVPWDDALNKAVDIGMLNASQAVNLGRNLEINRDDAIGIINGSMGATTAGGVTLAQKLVDDGVITADAMATAGYIPEPTATPTPTPVVLAVESVTADNLKEVVVVFNQELDKDTIVADNFKLNKSKTASPKLLDDGKSVLLTINSPDIPTGQLDNQTEYTLTVEKVKSIEGTQIAKTEKKFTAFDATLPTVESISYTGPKNIEIKFSEPMKTAPAITVKVGSSTLSVNNSGITGLGTNVLSVPLFSTLADGTTYTISVSGGVDFAGYANVIKTSEVAYAKDTTPPTATVTKATQEYVVVEFSKPVSGLHHGLFSHTFTAWKASKLTATDSYAAAAVTSGTKFYVWFNGAGDPAVDRPIKQGDTTLNILAKQSSPAAEIVDLWGNKFAETTLSITVTADTTAPEVKEIKIASESSLKVEFTKNVSFSASNIEILDAEGKTISGVTPSVVEASGGKTYTVNFGKSLAGKTIIVNITKVKDTTLNTIAMADYSTTLEVTDKTAPTIEKVTYKGTDNYLYVFFSENMDSESTLAKANYMIVNGTTFTALATDPEFVNGVKTVRFTLNSTQAALITTGTTKLLVNNVKDVAGNAITEKLSPAVADHDTAVIPAISKAEATATDKVVVTFSEELSIIDINAFLFDNHAAVAMEVALSDGKTVATFTLHEDNKLAAAYTSGKNVTYANAALIKNLFNVSPSAGETVEIADKIKPNVAADDIVFQNGKIILTFSENLNNTLAASVPQDLVITRGTTTLVPGVDYKVTVVNKVITVEKLDGGILDDGVYKIKTVDAPVYIRDNQGNKASAFTTAKEITNVYTAQTNAATFTIDFAAEKTNQVVPTTIEYKVASAADWTTGTGAKVDLTPGTDMQFRVKATSNTAAGPIVTLTVPARPAAPTGVAKVDCTSGNNGQLTGVSDTMEYTSDGGTTWTAVSNGATTVTGLAAGTYNVRYKATASAFASELTADLVIAPAP